jgi:hypothetical protein
MVPVLFGASRMSLLETSQVPANALQKPGIFYILAGEVENYV